MVVTPIDHFTVLCSVARPWNESEAGVDLVVIQTSLLFLWKSCCNANEFLFTKEKQWGLYQNKVNSSLAFIPRPGNWAQNCRMVYCSYACGSLFKAPTTITILEIPQRKKLTKVSFLLRNKSDWGVYKPIYKSKGGKATLDPFYSCVNALNWNLSSNFFFYWFSGCVLHSHISVFGFDHSSGARCHLGRRIKGCFVLPQA